MNSIEHRPVVLSERHVSSSVRWQSRIGEHGRHEVVALVRVHGAEVVVRPLTDGELQALLADGERQDAAEWRCASCGAANARDRKWCWQCSDHSAA